MKFPPFSLRTFTAVLLCGALSSPAAVLVYEGFATDAVGTGDNYVTGANLHGESNSRDGFTGSWSAEFSDNTTLNGWSRELSLNYSGFPLGEDGKAEVGRVSGTTATDDVTVSRSLSYTVPGEDTFYVSFLLRTDASADARIHFGRTVDSRVSYVTMDGDTGAITSSMAGSSATELDGFGLSGFGPGSVNLLVFEVNDDPSGSFPGSNPNTGFYDYYRFWINPVINPAGTDADSLLGTPDATGYSILRNFGGGSTPIAMNIFRMEALGVGGSARQIEVDEFRLSTDLSFLTNSATFAIPEPGTLSLLGLGVLGLRSIRRHRT